MTLRLLNSYGHVLHQMHLDQHLTDGIARDLFLADRSVQRIVVQPEGSTGTLTWIRPAHCGLAMLKMTA